MKRNSGVWAAAFLLGLGSTQLLIAQVQPVPVPFNKLPQSPKAQPIPQPVQPVPKVQPVQPVAPKVQPVTPPVQQPAVKVQPKLPLGPVLQPSVSNGVFRPGGVLQPGIVLQPGVVLQPNTINPGIVFPVAPKVEQPAEVVPQATGPRTLVHLTNGGSNGMTVYLRYINTDGEAKRMKAQTIASGGKIQIALAGDVATSQEKSETKYLVIVRMVREGFPDSYLGAKGQDGQLEDKNEFTGIAFRSFTTKAANGREIKNLSYTLKPRE